MTVVLAVSNMVLVAVRVTVVLGARAVTVLVVVDGLMFKQEQAEETRDAGAPFEMHEKVFWAGCFTSRS